jgi:uncharacterized protein YdaU (DUF1376 family)
MDKKTPATVKVDIFIPIYIGDYLKDTTRLTTEEHGAYLLLIFDYWQHGSIPDDDRTLCRITGMSDDAWSIARGRVLAYFKHSNGTYIHTRIDAELQSAKKRKETNVGRAKAAADARWKGHNKDAPSIAPSKEQALLEECPSPSPSPSPVSLPPKSTKKRFVPPSLDEANQYLSDRGNVEDPANESERFIDHFTSNGWKVGGKTKMVCWKSAIRNWEKNCKPKQTSSVPYTAI